MEKRKTVRKRRLPRRSPAFTRTPSEPLLGPKPLLFSEVFAAAPQPISSQNIALPVDAPADRSLPFAKLWPYLLAVFLMPLLVLWHRDNALYSSPRVGDAWFYLGYFRHLLEYKRDLFYGFYYGSRIPWLMPGFILHSVLPPVAANFFLHSIVQSTATISFFSILRLFAGARSALLGTLVFAVQPWVWAATGSDYVDGPSIAYGLLAMALLTYAATRLRARRLLVASGAALAGMIYTQLFCFFLVPLLLLYFIVLRWAWRRAPILQSAITLSLWAGAGFGIVTIAFAGINYVLDGNVWFYAPSIAQAHYMSKDYPQALVRAIVQNHWLVPWLWPAAGACLTAAALLPSGIRRKWTASNSGAILLPAFFLSSFAFMGWMQYRGITELGHHAYASLLLPFEFLVLGLAFWPATETMTRNAYLSLLAAAIFIFAVIWYLPGDYQILAPLPAQKVCVAWIACCSIGAFMVRRRLIGSILALAGFAGLTVVGLLHASDMHSDRTQFSRLIDLSDRINEIRKGRIVEFWYDRQEPNYPEYLALNSLYLEGYTRLSDSFPGGCETPVDPETLVVMTAQGERAADLARSALTKCWAPAGMHPEMEATETLRGPHGPYTMAIFRPRKDPTRWRPLRAVFDATGRGELQPMEGGTPLALPPERWVRDLYPVDEAKLTRVPGGLEIRTPVNAYGFAAAYPALSAPFSGWYHFVLRLRNWSGQFAFGARPGDDSTYLTADRHGHRVGDRRDMSLWVNLKAGEKVRLRTANNDLAGFGAASFVIESLTASGIPAQ
jgi:hypothetical protein